MGDVIKVDEERWKHGSGKPKPALEMSGDIITTPQMRETVKAFRHITDHLAHVYATCTQEASACATRRDSLPRVTLQPDMRHDMRAELFRKELRHNALANEIYKLLSHRYQALIEHTAAYDLETGSSLPDTEELEQLHDAYEECIREHGRLRTAYQDIYPVLP